MIYIDKYAYFSGLKETPPLTKILFGGTSLLACVASWSMVSFAIVFGTMFYMVIVKGKIPLGYYVKLLLLPLGFLILGVVGIIVNITTSPVPADSVVSADFHVCRVFVSSTGLHAAASLVCKSLAAVSCLYFIILTTPFRDIVHFMQKTNSPHVIVSLSVLIYQFIFLLFDSADIKLKSQLCRGGFRRLKYFPRDFGMLWGSVFVQSWLKTQWIFKSMQARGYEGHFKFVQKKDEFRLKEAVLLPIFLALVLVPNFINFVR